MAQIPSAQEMQARRRAALIVQVQCGQITATEAANQLGVSRKTYYEWEKKALQALVASQHDRPGGRPAMSRDPEKEILQRQAQELREQAQVLEQTLAIRQQLAELSRSKKNS
jgi:transposase